MNHIDLCAGGGGFSLAAEWMGWTTIAYSEINPYCLKLLKQHFPDARAYTDMRTTSLSIYRGFTDILTGGFPCQPFSNIGEQRGTADERFMWPEFRRLYNECSPAWVVPENVHGLLTWNNGKLFQQICENLETDGYEVCPVLLPASGCGAGHQRNRIWIIAYSAVRRLERGEQCNTQGHRQTANRPVPALVENRDWTEYAKSFVSRGVYGLSDRVDRTQILGNAIYPEVAFQIYEAIDKYNTAY